MGVLGEVAFGGRDEHLPGHAEVNDPLARWREVNNDVLADALHLVDARTLEDFGDLTGWRFQRLRLGADPDGFDHVSGDALIQAAGDGLDFGEFGHFEAVPSTWYSVPSVNNWDFERAGLSFDCSRARLNFSRTSQFLSICGGPVCVC